ncbi:MAG: ABC transporter ATP-binding protein [Candidatus Coproplasma sp.]
MLQVENLNKSYGSKRVLNDVSFSIPQDGTICGLIGLNGAGKSTLMKIICSLSHADSGKITVDGKDISEASEQRKVKIGFTIEAPAFYGGLTGKQNLCLLADLYPDLPKDAVNRSLETVGLRENANVKVKNYSLGMKQRLYLAYAILNEPTVLILDEPFNGIDPVSVKIFKDLLKSFAQKGATILISSHSILDIQSVCDRVIILDRGRIAYDCRDVQNENLEEKFFEITGASGNAQ